MTTAFEGVVVGGAQRPDGNETSAVAYWAEAEAGALPLQPWLRALLPLVYGRTREAAFEPPTWVPPAVS